MTSTARPQAVLYRMVMAKHICPFGLKAKHILERKGYAVEDRGCIVSKNRWPQVTDQVEQFFSKHIIPVRQCGIDAAMVRQKMSVVAFISSNLHGVGHRCEHRLQPVGQALRDSHLLRKMPHSDTVGRRKQHPTDRQRLDRRWALGPPIPWFGDVKQPFESLREELCRMMPSNELSG